MPVSDAFILDHSADDLKQLILSRDRWPWEDVSLAASTIGARRRLQDKAPFLLKYNGLRLPTELCAQQCSSASAAAYKALLARRICPVGSTIADLCGGLGLDALAFSRLFPRVIYNEASPELVHCTRDNFGAIGAGNISCTNFTLGEDAASPLPPGLSADIIYLDPARRDSSGSKVFRLEDCSPDILKLLDPLKLSCSHLLLKLSPMLDISDAIRKLPHLREIHVVALQGECKELLVWIDWGWNGDLTLTCFEGDAKALQPDLLEGAIEMPAGKRLTFSKEELTDRSFKPLSRSADTLEGLALFIPGKSFVKAAAADRLCYMFDLEKLDASTNAFICNSKPDDLKGYGKCYRIVSCSPLDKRSIRKAGETFNQAEVSCRNIPLSSDELRRRIGCKSDPADSLHIFGLLCRDANGKREKLLLAGERLF